MTHTPTHIVISTLVAPVVPGSKIRLWHCLAACLVLGFVAGAVLL